MAEKQRSQSTALQVIENEKAVSFTGLRKKQNYRICRQVGYNKNGGFCAAISGRLNQRINTENSWRPQCFRDCLCYVRVRLSAVCLIPMPVFYTVRCLDRVHDTHVTDQTGSDQTHLLAQEAALIMLSYFGIIISYSSGTEQQIRRFSCE